MDAPNLVAPEDGCPQCGEREVDRLVWRDDDRVQCQTCGRVYDPILGRNDEATI